MLAESLVALHVDQAFDCRIRFTFQDAQQLEIALFGGSGVDFHASHQSFDRHRFVLGR